MDSLYLSEEQFQDIFKNHLKIETYSKPIESLFGVRYRRKVNYKPYYQRNYVWDAKKASYFIESILLGTEIPPLIFFNNGEGMEVIDGRQRYETILRFYDNELALAKKGLFALKQLSKKKYEDLHEEVADIFLSSTLRIIEFEIVNEQELNTQLQDKVKKEIFGRYNSGITPLKKSEIENAVYLKDEYTSVAKTKLEGDSELFAIYDELFFRTPTQKSETKLEDVLSFIRTLSVIHRVPITYYATKKNELIARLYDQFADSGADAHFEFEKFNDKVKFVSSVRDSFLQSGQRYDRLFNTCLLWGLNVIENEGMELPSNPPSERFLNSAVEFYTNRREDFTELDRHYYGVVVKRFGAMADFLESQIKVDLGIYRASTDKTRKEVKDLLNPSGETESKLTELESLRLNKPDPSRMSIEDITNMMNRQRFLVRPPYQRTEVINLKKASAIIESILLGIALPVIFVYKRENGVSEVRDGQRRILTILGFLGQTYLDQDNKIQKTKNSDFKLRQLKILKEFDKKGFRSLPSDVQDKILDFELFVVTIEEKLNQGFDPVDLFIRLNDKPYPIKEHSFEMWNSWADKDIVTSIRKIAKEIKEWFYLKQSSRENFRDRMQNEEMLASLAFLFVKEENSPGELHLDIYQKEQRLNARVKAKKEISTTLIRASENEEMKSRFQEAINKTLALIDKTKSILLTQLSNHELGSVQLLNASLDELLFPNKERKIRTYQDFYILWLCISPLDPEVIDAKGEQVYFNIREVFEFFRDVPESTIDGKAGFLKLVAQFHESMGVRRMVKVNSKSH